MQRSCGAPTFAGLAYRLAGACTTIFCAHTIWLMLTIWIIIPPCTPTPLTKMNVPLRVAQTNQKNTHSPLFCFLSLSLLLTVLSLPSLNPNFLNERETQLTTLIPWYNSRLPNDIRYDRAVEGDTGPTTEQIKGRRAWRAPPANWIYDIALRIDKIACTESGLVSPFLCFYKYIYDFRILIRITNNLLLQLH